MAQFPVRLNSTVVAPNRRGRRAIVIGLSMLLLTAGASAPAAPESQVSFSAATSNDPETLMEVVQLAIQKGEHRAACDLLREVLDIAPDHEGAYELLLEQSNKIALTSVSPALKDARSRLPSRFETIESDHFVLLTDSDREWARIKARELERTYQEFRVFCAQVGLRPRPLEHKLVAVLFAQRNAYEAFAKRHDSVRESWIAGYYAPLGDRVVFYDVRSSPGLLEAEGQLESMRRELLQVQRHMRDARQRGDREASGHYASLASTYELHLDGERKRVEAFAQRVSSSTTIHESIHQLLFHTRVQHPRIQYPLWISEGLACSFETSEPDHGFGPDHETESRREGFESALQSERLLPLSQLIRLTDINGSSESTIEDTYHQCAALVQWMHRVKRDELRSYLELMQQQPSGRPTPARHAEIFEEAFGEVEQLEATWLKHERSAMRGRLVTP